MKNICTFLLTLLLLSSLNTQAQTTYILTDDDVVVTNGVLTSYSGSATAIIIPSILDGQTVTSIGGFVFRSKMLTSVTLPTTLTSIGLRGFTSNELTSVTLPEGFTSIGSRAFQNNNLTSVTLPASLTSIGEKAFLINRGLASIELPAFSSLGYNILWTGGKVPGDMITNFSMAYTRTATAIPYPITYYELDGGTNPATNPSTYTIETNTITLMAPTRVGYTFGGWYSEATFDNPVMEIATGTTGDKTFYAKWAAITYTINYELKGGTNAMANPGTYTIETNTITLMPPTRVGYAFGGWYSEATFDNPVTEIATGTTGDTTFYAKWVAITYDITYELDGGTNPATNPSTYTIEANTITLMTPTRAGYTFGGWYSDGMFQNAVTEIATGSTDNKAFHAKWAAITYTITYELKGGTNPATNPDTYTIEANTITLMPPTRGGYTFGGWYSDGMFQNAVMEIATGSTDNKAFYAKWAAITYDITYELDELDGGTNAVDNPDTYTIETSTITLMAPTREEYTFGGWYSEATFDNPVTEIATGTIGNKTFYAKWLKTYTITYVLDKGTNAVANPTSYNVESTTITLMAPTREGYTFGGWYSEATFDNPVTEIATGSTDNKTFHAKWLTSYTINYVLDGGTNAMDNPDTYAIETSTITLMTPTRVGYTFGGWYSEATFDNPVMEIATGTTGDKTFHARWLTSYTINYMLDGGTNAMDNPDTYAIETSTITLMTPTRVGYTFAGWYSEATFDNPVMEIATGTTGDKTLYAKWEIVLSLEDAHKDNTISIYPNPASDYFRLSQTSPERPQQMMLYDLSGHLVKQFSETRDNSYKVSGLLEGTYLLKIPAQDTTIRLLIVR